jgi:hypothetical protein
MAQDISHSISEFAGSIHAGWYYNKTTGINFDKSDNFEKLEILTDNLIYPLINSVKQLANKVDGTEQILLSGSFQGSASLSEIIVNDITINKLVSPPESTASILLDNSYKNSLMASVSNNQVNATMSLILLNLSSNPTSSKSVNVIDSNIILTGLNNNGVSVRSANIQAEIVYSNIGATPTLLTSSINILNNDLSASIQIQNVGNSIIARVYSQNNDWNYQSYTGTYSVGATYTLIRPNFNSTGKVYRPE